MYRNHKPHKRTRFVDWEDTVHHLADVRIMIVLLEAIECYLKEKTPDKMDIELDDLVLELAKRVSSKSWSLQQAMTRHKKRKEQKEQGQKDQVQVQVAGG